jgi:prepilin-type N-terminal cleavage/methylation domain-containing protein
MPHSTAHSQSGFTLLEVSLSVLIAVLILAVAIPSLTGVMGGSRAEKSFQAFDQVAREARRRAQSEGRNYVILWGRDRRVLMRPEEPANRGESEGLLQWRIAPKEKLELHLPAALQGKGATPDAIWTFWANGICEPAEVRYEGAEGKWSATYHPFTPQAEVLYE